MALKRMGIVQNYEVCLVFINVVKTMLLYYLLICIEFLFKLCLVSQKSAFYLSNEFDVYRLDTVSVTP